MLAVTAQGRLSEPSRWLRLRRSFSTPRLRPLSSPEPCHGATFQSTSA